jgi:hypothetical protein
LAWFTVQCSMQCANCCRGISKLPPNASVHSLWASTASGLSKHKSRRAGGSVGGGHNYATWPCSPSNAACNAPIVAVGSANRLQMLVYTHYGHPQLVANPSKGQGAPTGLLEVVMTMQLGLVHCPMQHAMRRLLPRDQQTASKCWCTLIMGIHS